jgi:hypothetical protein
MSFNDTSGAKSSPAAHALVIAQTSDLLLQACGLGSEPGSDQLSQTQQSVPPARRRGRPQQVCWTQLWSSLLLCAL